MDLFNSLASIGLSRELLQVFIVCGVFIVLLGMYWQFFAIGAIGVFVMFLFAPNVESKPKLNSFADSKIQQIENDRKKDFMSDCMRYGDTEQKCLNIWNNQERP